MPSPRPIRGWSRRSGVVGRVAFTLSGLGWWLRALPLLAVGAFSLLVARGACRWRDRRAFERVFGVVVVAVVLLAEHPLISGQLITVEADPGHPGWLKGLFVNTGLLPASPGVAGAGAPPVVAPSHLAWARGPAAAGSSIRVHLTAALPGWAWALVALIVAAPMVSFLLYRARCPMEADPTGIGVAQALVLATPVRHERRPRHARVAPERQPARHRSRGHASEVARHKARPLVHPTPTQPAEAGRGDGGAQARDRPQVRA